MPSTTVAGRPPPPVALPLPLQPQPLESLEKFVNGTRSSPTIPIRSDTPLGDSRPSTALAGIGPEGVAGSDPFDKQLIQAEVVPHPLIDDLIDDHHRKGVLIPLKTTLELRQDHTLVQAYITRAPTKAANSVVGLLREMMPEGKANGLPHLRRCAKPCDIPAHLKTQLMNETAVGRQIHTGRSNWIYILLGETKEISRPEIVKALAGVEGMDPEQELFVSSIPVPLVPPTSQVQAALWTTNFWPTVYRKNNPLGPHPSVVGRATDEIREDASIWLALAHRVALKGKAAGLGDAMGAVVVQREGAKVELVAVAADARWHGESERVGTGNPMAHCVLRAISLVAQKLVRAEHRLRGATLTKSNLMYDALQDSPLLDEEALAYEAEHPNPDGYLCHGLEMYLTHEPCVQCSMSILHSRMGKVIFGERMPMTGGMASEDRGHGHPELEGCGGGRGLGLFWRRELNWSLLAWEWESGDNLPPLPHVNPYVHA